MNTELSIEEKLARNARNNDFNGDNLVTAEDLTYDLTQFYDYDGQFSLCVPLTSVAVFLIPFYHIYFGVGLPAYFRNYSLFSREHIFIEFNEFPSLMC